MNRVNRLHNHNTHWGLEDEWTKLHVRVYYTGPARGFGDEQDSMNDKQSGPCQTSYPFSLPLLLPCWGFSLSTSLMLCLLDSLSASVPATQLLLSCLFSLPLRIRVGFSISWLTSGKGKSYFWVFLFLLIQTRRKTWYVPGCNSTDPVIPAR